MIAFAANSVLCRLALAGEVIDAATFTNIRLISGIITLIIILQFYRNKSKSFDKGSWIAGMMLFLYAITFSFAYILIDTGTGALILFGAVQVTMLSWSILKGHRLQILELLGSIIALSGFLYLIFPGVSAPSSIGFILMTIAGVSWGIHTLLGHSSNNPLIETAYNFFRTIPLVIFIFILTFNSGHYSIEGILLAVLSGGMASGIGYAIWYYALRELTSVQAAVVQLFVPLLAAFGGVFFISEIITIRLFISALLIIGGIFLVVFKKNTG